MENISTRSGYESSDFVGCPKERNVLPGSPGYISSFFRKSGGHKQRIRGWSV